MAKEFEPTLEQKGLIDFLIKSASQGYAEGESKIIREENGSYSTHFKDGDYEIHDSWDGGEPFAGRERVTFKGRPYWSMVYFGVDLTHDEGTIPTLRAALKLLPEELPVRGPKRFENGDYIYENNWEGDMDAFSGLEEIYLRGERVYNCSYRGGLVAIQK